MILTKEIEIFLEEDLRDDDVSCTLVPNKQVNAVIFTKQNCIVSGLEIAAAILDYMNISYAQKKNPGDFANKGEILFELSGDSVAVLRAERLVLNFLSRLCGIATNTHEYVSIVEKSVSDYNKKNQTNLKPPKIAATRKTTPGIRKFEKKAVIDGGGDSHRNNLADLVMIKDNHIEIMGFENAFLEAKKKASFSKKIEMEADLKEQAVLAARLGADIVMLDNMTPAEIRETVALLIENGLRDSVLLEASGGIKKENLADYAASGVDVISLSAVTNDAKWIDISLDIQK
ncbi:putative nicotinate-nucleotide pyrophosphorylase [carboxylating] [Methanosarcinaceae archaeon Ag5]|uniref:Nicotinate-nucleotide pyrophosphorylase [carboxylating] n=1 Tax=Methanolapillus africanus TaxID=3028297 RepID=A0AAE4SE81_9EURY|nr:putative nicotinate-nucleotide pyrophosphorylase [carboxylating] [Methanosarcinaceae archaeon Ag5]